MSVKCFASRRPSVSAVPCLPEDRSPFSLVCWHPVAEQCQSFVSFRGTKLLRLDSWLIHSSPCNLGQGYLIVLVFNSLFYKMRILITIAIIIITIVIIIVLPHRTLEEGMATHSSILPWRISMDSRLQERSLAACSPWGQKELDMTKHMRHHIRQKNWVNLLKKYLVHATHYMCVFLKNYQCTI